MTEHTDVSGFVTGRLRAIEMRVDSFSHMDRISRALPMIAEAIEKMRAAELTEPEIAGLLRHAANELSGDAGDT